MSTYVSGQRVTIGGRNAKILTILTDRMFKVRFDGEYHSDIASVDDIRERI